MKKKILFICGTLHQTRIMYEIARELKECDLYFTPYYGDGFIKVLQQAGLCDFCSLGGQARKATENFMAEHELEVDLEGMSHEYDLVFTCSDLLIPKNIEQKKIIHVQEGMTDPENLAYHVVKNLGLPRFLANTSMTGLSHTYETFCVMSEGWKEVFVNKGVNPDKIRVTGIPLFDNVDNYRTNDFPHKGYVLGATSHLRETFKFENRKQFIEKVVSVSDGKPIIFKLHPNERHDRAIREIEKYAPGSLIYTNGNTNHMIANCDIMVTRYSTVVLVAAGLGKIVYSDLDSEFLKKLTPIQNGGTSGAIIADIGRSYLE